jgi:HD-GYP domain-containing protein (c-di-GMP phosphodiesterase class II)
MSEGLARRHRGRILTSLMLLLFAVGVVPLLGTSYNLYSRSRESLEYDQKVIQLDKARGLSHQVAIYVQSLVSHVAAVARTLEVGAASGALPRIRDSKSLERYVTGDVPFLYVSVVDVRDGRGPGAGFQLQERPIIAAQEEAFQRGRQGDPMISHPIISTSLQEPVIVLSQPIMADKKPYGVVVAVATLLPVAEMTKQMGEEKLYQVYVVDTRGRLVAHSDQKRQLGVDLSKVEIVEQFLESEGVGATTVPFTIGTDRGTIRMLGTYARVPDKSGWGVIVQVEEDQAYDAALQMRRHAIIFVGVVTLLAAFLGTLFANQISRPIQKLAEGARRLAGGEYATRVFVKSENEVGVLADAFNQMGGEIEKAIEEIREAAAKNKELFVGSIRMLANAIDEKDPYTRGHSERVAYYSMVTAKYLGMSPDDVERVHLSGILHDVGKIGIEDKILRKAAALTDDEYEMMKQHPTKGAHILAAVPMLKDMAGAGLQHHENWDGSGYPDGLKGEEIPLLGRIVSVADAFDAMTTDRPYSKAMTYEAAVARLRFLAGKKFDGVCVEAFAKAVDAGELTPAKARRASVVARQQGKGDEPEGTKAAPASPAEVPSQA